MNFLRERSSSSPAEGRTRWDLWVRPLDLAVEVKYSRPIPSARNRPFTQIYGSLLADFNKLMRGSASQRLVILVSDPRTLRHMTGSAGGQLLPFTLRENRTILPPAVAALSSSAAAAAESDGPWQPLRATLAWTSTVGEWLLYAWTVDPAPCPEAVSRPWDVGKSP
jgi:hypothetical protein